MEQNISMQQLKEQRLTPAEKFVLETIKGAKAGEPDKDGNVRWYKDEKCILRQVFSFNLLGVNYDAFMSKLRTDGLSYDESKRLITRLLHKHTNNGQLKIEIYF